MRPTVGTGTLPRVESADHAGDGMDAAEGISDRVRSSPRLVIGAAVGALLLLAWIGWAIYVASDHGARAGLGVVIVWPAMLAALGIISLPFIGGYLLIKRLSPSEAGGGTATADPDTADDDAADSDDEPEDSPDDGEDEEAEEDERAEEDDDEEAEEDEESESDAEDSSKS